MPVPKIKFDPPSQGKNALVKSFIKSAIFSRCGKWNFASTPFKITIPLGNSVGDHMKVIEIYWVGNDFSSLRKSVIF